MQRNIGKNRKKSTFFTEIAINLEIQIALRAVIGFRQHQSSSTRQDVKIQGSPTNFLKKNIIENRHRDRFLGVFCVFRPYLDLNISESSVSMGKIFWKPINIHQSSQKNANRHRLDEMGRSYGSKTRKNVQKCRLHQLRASISRERWHLWLSFFDLFRAKDQSYPTVYHFPRDSRHPQPPSRSLPFSVIKEYTLQLHNHSARLLILRISRVLSDPEISPNPQSCSVGT